MFRNYSTGSMRALCVGLVLGGFLLTPSESRALSFTMPNLYVTPGAYFTWGAGGFSGYGIRDNAGTLEFKNSGGSWKSLSSIISDFCAGGGCGGGSSVAWSSITGKPYPVNTQTWSWSGQSGQPSWLWGSNDGTNMYVWSPSNFSVNYANSAGSAGSVPWSGVSGKSGTFSGASFSYCGQYINFSGGLATGNAGSNNCGGADIAERYVADGALPVERGFIVALSASTTTAHLTLTNPARGESTTTPYEMTTANVHVALVGERARMLGAVPSRAFDIGQSDHPSDGTQLVTLAGHVPLHVTLEHGPIAIGDPITLSDTKPGYGTKAATRGKILGYALAPYDHPGGGESGGDMIEVFVHLENWEPEAAQGFTLIDQASGTPSCVTLTAGQLTATPGACR